MKIFIEKDAAESICCTGPSAVPYLIVIGVSYSCSITLPRVIQSGDRASTKDTLEPGDDIFR